MKRAYEIYGKPVRHVRWCKTAKMAKPQAVGTDLRSKRGEQQVMYGDNAWSRKKPFMVFISKPLVRLVTATPLSSVKTKALAEGADLSQR